MSRSSSAAHGRSGTTTTPNIPIGLALIVISLVVAGTMLLLMANRAGPFKPARDPKPWNPSTYEYSWPLPFSTAPPGPSASP
ncbi:hypothetical protein [Streptomyces sp. ISL-44]|uniref:hypothetical protein n=1 Tax=Streptomyces sp. ISL-44 TaxID=2819184 RepID=UPI002036454B|nr:hypothetical protein [Streptomyces sp. ISL-44]